MPDCKKCQQEFSGEFCSNCGQPAHVHRIDRHYLSHELQHLFHFEKGFLYTMKELLLRPGHSIREYLEGDRVRHMKPLPFMVVASLIYTIIEYYTHFDEIDRTAIRGKSIEKIFDWVQTHYAYANIIMGAFIVAAVRLLFRKTGYNIYEITILIMFTLGEGMLLLSIISFLFGLWGSVIFKHIALIVSFIYPTWVFVQFFNRKSFGAVLKAFFSYLLGVIAFWLACIVLSFIMDIFFK